MKPSPVELELLVIRAQDGEPDALSALVERWHPAFVRQARRCIDDHGLAHDAVQDAWAGIVRGLRRLDDPATFAAWALRIVTRRAVDVARRRRREARAESDARAGVEVATAPDHESDDELVALRAAVARLDRDHRVVVELHYLEGLAMPEIAAVLDLPLGTVKSRAFHARRRLRAELDAAAETFHADDKEKTR